MAFLITPCCALLQATSWQNISMYDRMGLVPTISLLVRKISGCACYKIISPADYSSIGKSLCTDLMSIASLLVNLCR